MLHHIVLEVSDLDRASRFYDAMLSPLGWRRHTNSEEAIGYGISRPVLFITERTGARAEGTLVSLGAPGIAAVKAAWEGGCDSGGSNVAQPGETGAHGSGSYSAFVRDPDGHDIEITVGGE
ncbi:MAG: VOC family protein [Solirubrobacterales bacterium]|nr:VOC family protein [Solirubrobacterales bacterium]